MRRAWIVCMVLGIALGACGDAAEPAPPAPAVEVLPLEVALVDATVVAGGALLLNVSGGNLLRPTGATVVLEGDLGGAPVRAELEGTLRQEGAGLRVEVPWDVLSLRLDLQGDVTFTGAARVIVADVGESLRGEGALEDASIRFREGLTPAWTPPAALEIYLNQVVEFDAEGLLRPGEGTSAVRVQGELVTAEGRRAIDATLPVELVGDARTRGAIRWPARDLGVEPGACACSIWLYNAPLAAPEEGTSPQPLALDVLATEIDLLDPARAGRGQVFTVLGRGFVPPDPEHGISMFFQLDGQLVTATGDTLDLRGDRAALVAPDDVASYTEARVALRTERSEGPDGLPVLTGIAATPGDFVGTVTPVLVEGGHLTEGVPWSGMITITAPHQVVFIKFLPTFGTGLERFGLRNVEPEVRARVLEVVRRDYEGVGITFSDERPTDFVEYSIIEVGGPDPNGVGLFGLDNTEGKDVGNLRLDDIVGGQNAGAREQGYLSFGGVFVESFLNFSPTLHPEQPTTDPVFDQTFSPFAPELGGAPVQGDEWPQGPRQDAIAEAIRVLGSIAGDSLAHEVGHSLGLAYFPEDEIEPTTRYHNASDEEGSIMDEGINRPFGERAELGGYAVPHFNDTNRAYLLRVLPTPP